MLVDIKIVQKPSLTKEQKYPLFLHDLVSGKFYETDSGQVVFVSRAKLDHNNPLNIENGIGGYAQGRERFRNLNITKVEFSVTE